jgi:hypothetical protein
VLGMLLRERRDSVPVVGGAALLSSTIFFIITNFAVWAMGTTYPKTGVGLAACYVAAIPFFGNTVASDLIYAAMLFGLFALAERHLPKTAKA